jgi:PAS domain S-box-containing protein
MAEAVKILVVEDETDLEFLITRKFRKRIQTGELQFLFAHNGLEALKQLEEHADVLVVLCDINMPQMDGLTLLTVLNQRHPLLRTVMVTAYGDMKNIRTAMNRGAYDFLTKPIDFNDLEITMNRTIRYVQDMQYEVETRRHAEAQLIQLKKAVENMRLGVTITDLSGKILYTNPGEAHMHGFEVEELVGQDVRIFAPPYRRRPMSLEHIQEWSGSVRESVNVRKDGSVFPVWLISDMVKDADGKPIAIVTSCEDITEQKRAEEELERHRDHLEELVYARTAEVSAANAKLAELNVNKDKFFSIISHDLRNPFSVMLGYSQLLEANVETYDREKIKHLFGKLHMAAERLYALLDNLLTWARIQQGAMEYAPDIIEIRKMTEETIELLLSQAGEKQITLQHTMDGDVLAYGDYNMASTVLRNLISNAIKFTHEGGRIQVAVRQDDEQVELAVADNGVGVAADDLPTLFRIDIQHSHSGTAGERGTGLGLILCKDLAEKNGGKIWVESEAGQGTTVRFTLPKKK